VNRQTLLDIDSRWSKLLRVAERPGPLKIIAALLAHSGDSWFWILGLILTWWWAQEPWKSWAVRMIGMILALALLVMLLKLSIRRRRPEGQWGSIYRNTDPHSFPSGHAARATLLVILTLVWGPTWLSVILLIWAPLVALARVAMGVHYLSDILAGAGLGLLFGLVGVIVQL
jgi:undecaprenyl-diphosphatase